MNQKGNQAQDTEPEQLQEQNQNKESHSPLQEKEYFVKKIIGKRVCNDIIEYKVKWKGYPLNQSTWEPASNLTSIQALLDKYDNKITENPQVKTKNKTHNKDDTSHLSCLFKNDDPGLGKIILQGIKTVKPTKEGLFAVVFYEENGVVKKGFFPTSELRERAPELLIDFYESKIKFTNEK